MNTMLQTIPADIVNLSGALLNDKIIYSCPVGFKWNDGTSETDKTITCLEDGNWTMTITVQCKRMSIEFTSLLEN